MFSHTLLPTPPPKDGGAGPWWGCGQGDGLPLTGTDGVGAKRRVGPGGTIPSSKDLAKRATIPNGMGLAKQATMPNSMGLASQVPCLLRQLHFPRHRL